MTKHDIKQASIRLFQQYGIKSVTMDDIARHSGVSKKTLYLQLLDCMETVTATVESRIQQIKAGEPNPLCCLAKIYYMLLTEIIMYGSVYFFYLRKMPMPFQKYRAFREHMKSKHIIPLFTLAIRKKYIRHEVDPQILCNMLFLLIDDFVTQNNEIRFADSFQKIYQHIILITLQGCLAPGNEDLLNSFMDEKGKLRMGLSATYQ
jgi:hypothetical protein